MKTKYKIIVLGILFLYSYCAINAQETTITVKFKSEECSQLLEAKNDSGFLELKSASRTLNLVPSYPNAKTPELRLYYDIKMPNNVTESMRAIEAENLFSEVNIDTAIYTIDECITTNDASSISGSDYATELIRADCAWSITMGNPNIVIGIVDTDFRVTHEDLRNQFLSVSGPVTEFHRHGTGGSGIAGAEPNNGKGVKGVGYNTKLRGYRVPHATNSEGQTSSVGSTSIKDAIWNAYLDGCRIINVSWTGTQLNPLAAKEITESGVVLAVSAGNSPTATNHSSIAHIPGVICVSGVDRDNNYWSELARNQYVDLCAPAKEIPTTNNLSDSSYTLGGWTSAAAPFVSAAAALVLSLNPDLTAGEVENILKSTAAPINNASLYPGVIGTGRLDVYAAVLAVCQTTTYSGHTVISSNTAISGCSVFVEDVTVKSDKTLTIEALGGDFTHHTEFVCKENASFYQEANSTVIVKDSTLFVLKPGSKYEIESGGLLSIRSGSTLMLKDGSNLIVKGTGRVVIESGAYLHLNQGAIVHLADSASEIRLKDGYNYGLGVTNPFSGYTGGSYVTDYRKIKDSGSGTVVLNERYDQYIQNRTFTTTNSFVGQNVHIGYDVIPSSSPTKGNVILEPGSNVTVKATDDVYIKNGFEVKLGATFTTIPAE